MRDFESVAIDVAQRRAAVVEAADVFETAPVEQPTPVAACRTGGYCVVLVETRRSDGSWRCDVVAVRNGDVEASGGGIGRIRRRSEVSRGAPRHPGTGRSPADDEGELEIVRADGVSADERVRLIYNRDVVAEAAVAAHGHFVLAAILPRDAVTVEAG